MGLLWKNLITVLACLAAVSCSNAVVVHDGRSFFYDPGEFEEATRKGAIETVVKGNPFDVDKVSFDASVLKLMNGQSRVYGVKFVQKPNSQTDPRFRVVVAFNLPISAGSISICRDTAKLPSTSQGGNLNILMIFCKGDDAKSNARATVREIKSSDDPKFARVVKQLTYFMSPDDDLLRQREYDD